MLKFARRPEVINDALFPHGYSAQTAVIRHPLRILGMFPLTLFIDHITFSGEIYGLFQVKLTVLGFSTFFFAFVLACILLYNFGL
jgi:hypothetical protein